MFLAPYMLIGGLAASIPVILHFFYRSRYKTVPWAAMKFLLTSIEQTSRRLKFQELLLLLLRTALLLLLALALARPTFQAAIGGGDAVDAVIVLDTSLSMQARSGPNNTCFDNAREAARTILNQLPANSTVQVVTVSDTAEMVGPRDAGRVDLALELLDDLAPSDRGSDLHPGLVEGARILAQGPSSNKEMYILSDMQRSAWETRGSEIKATLDEVRKIATVSLIRCVPLNRGNVAIVGITPQTTLRSGERADFAVLVRNAGNESVKGLTVTLTLDGQDDRSESQALAEVAAGETRAVVVGARIETPGRHVVRAVVRPDDIEGDNRLERVIVVNDRVGVLVVDGAADIRDPRRSASYYLSHALNPEASGLPLSIVPVERASPRDLGGKELCILVNVPLNSQGDRPGLSPEFVRALEPFVKEGKGLWIIAGDRVDPKTYNDELFERSRLLPYKIARVATAPPDKPWTLDRATAEFPPFVRFRQEQGYASIDRIEVRTALELVEDKTSELARESRTHLRLNTGKPVLASRRIPGQGEVLLLATSVHDDKWTDLYVTPAFVPFVQIATNALLEGGLPEMNRRVQEPLVAFVPRDDAETAFDLVPPEGPRQRLGFPTSVDGRFVVQADGLQRAGVYHIVPAGREPGETDALFAVTPDTDETEDLAAMPAEEINTLLGFTPVHLTAGDGGTFTGAERLNREATWWLLGLLLLLVIAEMILAWYCGRAW
jgi:hypothetical protein